MILGLSGKALSGKDTTADYLIEKHGWCGKAALAENLKRACMKIFGMSEKQVFTQSGKSSLLTPPVILTFMDIQSILSWMRKTHDISLSNKSIMDFECFLGRVLTTPREVLQFVGTDIMRTFEPNYHTEVIFRSIEPEKNLIITDVRFPNEAKSVLDNGGCLVRINRDFSLRAKKNPNISDTHSSETALDDWTDWSYILDNNSEDLETLYNKIDIMLEDIKNANRLSSNQGT